MARGELLFSKYDLSMTLLDVENKIKASVGRIDANALLSSSTDSLCDELLGLASPWSTTVRLR